MSLLELEAIHTATRVGALGIMLGGAENVEEVLGWTFYLFFWQSRPVFGQRVCDSVGSLDTAKR